MTRNTLVMADDILVGLRPLTDAVHDEGAAISAQLGHAGLVANVRSNGSPSLALDPGSTCRHGVGPGGDRRPADQVVDQFRGAAAVAVNAGSTPSSCTSGTTTC